MEDILNPKFAKELVALEISRKMLLFTHSVNKHKPAKLFFFKFFLEIQLLYRETNNFIEKQNPFRFDKLLFFGEGKISCGFLHFENAFEIFVKD